MMDLIAHIEDFLCAPVMNNDVNLTVQVEKLRVELVSFREAFNYHDQVMEERTETFIRDAIALSESIKVRLDDLDGKVTMMKCTTINVGETSEGDTVRKIKVLELKPFHGTRNTKALENFL